MNPVFDAPAVCNTGPLIGLARIEMAWLPFRLFPEVIVPEEVRLARRLAPERQVFLKMARDAAT
jgi:predicted nucleic acid-binding protein